MNEPQDILKNITVTAIEGMTRENFLEFTQESIDYLSSDEFTEVVNHTDHRYELKRNGEHDLNVIHDLIINWAEARGIIPNGNTLTQSIKTLEEVHELIQAIDRKDKLEIVDAYGDIFVTIVIGAYLNGTPLIQCAAGAYDVIKDRTGTLLPNGDFVKDQ